MDKNILFFDGVCHLCNSYIDFLAQFKSKNIFYAPLQGTTAQQILSLQQTQNLDSVIYYKKDKVLKKSTAVIESLSDTYGAFKILKIFYVIPEKIRDYLYDLVAKNRYKLFGQKDSCRIPTPEEKRYILD